MNARLIPLAAFLFLSGLVVPLRAHAQNTHSVTPVVGTADKGRKIEQAPPALPGSRAEQNPIAPSDRPTNDMQPNEALFDAINRGDTPVAKDAINRGADLAATNVLGLTPLELSIDLGRNDITFLLLSLQGASGSSTQRSAPQQGMAAAAVPPTPTPAQRRAQLAADRRAQLLAQREARQQGAGNDAAPGPAAGQAPPLFAGNGGTPNAQAGFVGFGR